jgi:hypothetical protein
MRYCRFCRKLSAGDPRFCIHCRASFNVKRCPAGHLNPRGSRFCETCGSPDLSRPQPRAGKLALLLSIVLFALLTLGTLAFAGMFARQLIRDPSALLPLMLAGVGIGFLWLLFAAVHSTWR